MEKDNRNCFLAQCAKTRGKLTWKKFILENVDWFKAFVKYSPDFKRLEQFLEEAKGLRGTAEYTLIRRFVELLKTGAKELPYR